MPLLSSHHARPMRSPLTARYAPIDAPDVVVMRAARFSIFGSSSALRDDERPIAHGDTIYLTAADKDGNVISLIQSIYEAFVQGLAAAVKGLPIGPGMDPNAAINPLVSRKQQLNVLKHIDLARQEGARVVAGGERLEGDGFFVQPTVLADVNHEMTVSREEVFGPVLSVIPFTDEDAMIELANDSVYGLAASLWTNDLSKAMNLVPRIEAGTVWVNAHVLLDPNMPFGGVKQSGMGREFGRTVIEAYTELKSVCISH